MFVHKIKPTCTHYTLYLYNRKLSPAKDTVHILEQNIWCRWKAQWTTYKKNANHRNRL